jgi:hypothetical protein
MREPTIWLTALRDVWAVKARPFRPSTTGLSVAQITKLLLHEIHLEARLSSVFQPRQVREHVKLEGRPQHIRFVPGTGGSYITVYHDGRTELRSLMCELLDVVQDADDAPPPLNVRVVPVSAHSANVIVVHAAKRCVVPIVCHRYARTRCGPRAFACCGTRANRFPECGARHGYAGGEEQPDQTCATVARSAGPPCSAVLLHLAPHLRP